MVKISERKGDIGIRSISLCGICPPGQILEPWPASILADTTKKADPYG